MTFAEKLALEKKRKAFSEVLAKDNPGLITGEDKGGLTQPILGKSERDGTAPFGTTFNVAQQHKADELFDNDEKVKQKAISDAQLLYMLRGGGDEFRTALTIADTKRSKNKESGDTSGIYHNTISDIYKESYFSELQKAPTLENYKKFIDAQGRSPYASGSYKGNDALAVATSIMYSGNKDFKYEDDAFAKKLFGEEENRILTMERERDSKVKSQKESTSLYENLKDTQDDIADMAVQFGAFAGFREQADKATDRIKERSIKNNEEKKEKAKRGAEISALGDEIAYRKANLEFQKQYYQLSKAKDFNEYNHNIPGKNIAAYHPQVKASLDTMFDMAEYDENGVNFLGLTKEQVELFYYIGNTQGSKAAQKYIDTLLPLTAPESAKYRYNMVKDIPVIKQIDGTFQNLAGGLGGAIEGLINAGTSAVWKTFEFKVDPMTAAQPYTENAKGAEKVLYGVAQGTGQMLPTIGASFINPGLGKAVFGTSVYGNSYKEARKKGYSQSASFGYGMANAGLELALESIGGFSFGGKGKISYGGRLASKLDDVFKASPKMRAMAAIGGKAAVDYASEFSEEYLAEVFGPALSNFFLGENNEIKLYSDAHLEAGIIGGFTGLLLQSPSYVQSVARTFKKGSYGAESAFYINAASSVLEGEMYKGNSKVFEGLSKAEKAEAIEAYRKEKLYGAAYKAIFGHISQGVLEGRSLGTIMSDISAEGIDISEFEGDIRNAYSVALASNGADARLDRAIEEGLASNAGLGMLIEGIASDTSLISQISDFNGLEGDALRQAISSRIKKVSLESPLLNEVRSLISQGEPTAYIIDSLISRGGRYVLPFTVDGAVDIAKAESLISGIRNSVIADEVNKRGLTGLDANHYIREAILRDRAADRVYSLARDGFSYEEARVTEGALAFLLTDEQFSNVFARGQSEYNRTQKAQNAQDENGTAAEKVIDLSDITSEQADVYEFTDSKTNAILDGAGSYGKAVYDSIMRKLDKSTQADVRRSYIKAIAYAYEAGLSSKKVNRSGASILSDEQFRRVYDAGKKDANSRSNVVRKKNARLIKDKALRKAKLSSREVKMLEALAKICGRDIRFSTELHGNAKIDLNTGEIVISTEAKSGVRWAAVHEVFHALRIDNPAEANRLMRTVFDIISKNTSSFEELFSKYSQLYLSDITDAEGHLKGNWSDIIEEEIAADMIGYVISNSEALAKITGEQRNVLQRFIDRLESLFARNSGYLDRLSPEMRRAFYDVYREADAIAEQFKAAIEKQSEVVKEKGVEVERDENKKALDKTGIKYSKSLEELSIKEQITKNKSRLSEMKVVASYNYEGTFKNSKEVLNWAKNVLKNSGYKVERQNFGTIILDEKRLKNGLAYLEKDEDYIAYALIPKIIKQGIIIDEHTNHKGRGYSTTTFAAPVLINGTKSNMAVVIRTEGKHYYKLHRVIMPKGEVFEYTEKSSDETAAATLNAVDTPTTTTSTNHYTQKSGNVNTNNVKNSRDLSEDVSEREEKNPDLSDNDLSDYIKTGKTLHTRNKKQRMLESGKKPILTSYVEFKEFISNVISGKAPGEVRAFKKVGRRLAEAIQNKKNSINMLGKYLELNADDLRESYKKHLEPKEIGDIPLSEQDFERIPEYLDEFDDVLSVNTYNNKIEIHLYKETEEGYIRILTVVSSERNSLQITKLIGVSKEKFEKKYAKKIEGNIGSLWSKTKNSIPSTTAQLTADVPSNTSIYHSSEKSNGEIVNNEKKQYSEKNNEKHSRDLTEREMSDNKIKTLAGHLRGKYNSTYSKDDLTAELKEIYGIYEKGRFDEADDRVSSLGKSILALVKPQKITDDNAKSILRDIRGCRVKLSSVQLAEAKHVFGNTWRDDFMGKIVITDKALTSLDQQWQEWCELYPQYFKPDVNEGNMISELHHILKVLKSEAVHYEDVDTSYMLEDIIKDIKNGVYDSSVGQRSAGSINDAERRLIRELIADKSLKRWGLEIGRLSEAPSMSIEEAVKKVKDSFGINVVYGGDASVSKDGATGSYNESARTIRTKFRNDLPSICHALGYHIDSKLKVIDSILNQTAKVSSVDSGGIGVFESELSRLGYSSGNDSAQLIREGFAEFIRMYLTSKNLALEAAPVFFSHFESLLETDGQLQSAVEESASVIASYFAQSAGQRAGSAVMSSKEYKKLNKPRGKEAARRVRDWVVTHLFDRYYGIKKVEKQYGVFDLSTSKNAYVRATLSLQARGRAARLLEDGFYDENGIKVGDSFFDIIAPLGAEYSDKFKAFGDYLTFVHAIEWLQPYSQQGKKTSSGKDIYKAKAKGKVFGDDTLNDAETLKGLVQQLEAKHPEFKSIAKKIYEYQDNLMEYYLIPSGAVSRDQAEVFRAQYPHYVPFNRMNSAFGDATGSGKKGANIFSNLSNPIKKADGSSATIRHPLESIINSTVAAVDFKMKNDVMLTLIDEFTGEGAFPGVMQRVYSTKQLQELEKKGESPFIIEEAFGTDALNKQLELDGKETRLGMCESSEKVYSPVADKEKGIVFAWVNGEKRFYQVYDRDLYNSVANLEVQNLKAAFKVFNTITNILKVTMTMRNPLFGPGNVYRDFMTFHYNTTSNADIFSQLMMYAGSIKSIISKDESYRLYKALGGMDSSKYTADMDVIKRTVNRNNSKAVKWNKMTARDLGAKLGRNIFGLKFLWDKWFQLNDVLETLPRLSEFKYTMEQTHGDVQLAMYRAQDVTTNFSRSGTWGRNINSVFLFSNAEMQGIDKMIRNYSEASYTAKNKKGEPDVSKVLGKVIKTVGWSMVLTALKAFLNRRDEEAEREYSYLSEFVKNNYDVFYISDGYFLKLPKEQNLAMPRTSMERLIDGILGDGVDLIEFGSYIWDGFMPDFIPDVFDIGNFPHQILNNTPISVITDVAFNRDYKGDEIVPSYMTGAEYSKYNAYTSAFSVNLASLLYKTVRIDISPMAIDHYIGAFGYWGSLAKNLVPNKDVSEGGIVKAAGKNILRSTGVSTKFISDARYSTDLIDNIYDGKEKAEKKQGLFDSGDNMAVIERYSVMSSLITNFNKASRQGSDKQQRLDRELLERVLTDYDANKLTEGQEYAAYLYDLVGSEKLFESSFPKPTYSDTRTKDGKKHVTTVNLDANLYMQFCDEISQMREEVRLFIKSLGLEPEEASAILIKSYDAIDKEVKARYRRLYGKCETGYIYKPESSKSAEELAVGVSDKFEKLTKEELWAEIDKIIGNV